MSGPETDGPVASDYRAGLIRAAEIVEETARARGWLVRDGYAGTFAAAIRAAVVDEEPRSGHQGPPVAARRPSPVADSGGTEMPLYEPLDGDIIELAQWPGADGGLDG